MKVLVVENVNIALVRGTKLLFEEGALISPRGMQTLEYPTPVATVYKNPLERVLFSPARDANPFFHLMEAMWIINGDRDVAWLSQFNKGMRQYSDDGVIYHGAYGHRLRRCNMDQIEFVISKFRKEKDTRQCVLQIWDYTKDLDVSSKDIPCNDMIFLKIRNGKLNMTVCCRSNDMIWGAYGSNVVMFSFLLEYLAARIGVEVGTYTQISDSFHAYVDNPQFEKIVASVPNWEEYNPYSNPLVGTWPLVDEPATFDIELKEFMCLKHCQSIWDNLFFPKVAIPMYKAWFAHKKNKDGWRYLEDISATDWRLACQQWLKRRGDCP